VLLFLTTSKYLAGSSFLCTIHGQAVVRLNLHPSTHILALIRHTRRKPLCKILIALCLIERIRDSQKLRACKTRRNTLVKPQLLFFFWVTKDEGSKEQNSLISKLLPPLIRPILGPRNPRLLQRNQMIDIHISSSTPSLAIVIRIPRARRSSTSRGRHHTSAIAFEYCFARVAFAADGDPVFEEIAVVGWRVGLWGDFDGGEVLDCCCG
jgi:hypothetical protein